MVLLGAGFLAHFLFVLGVVCVCVRLWRDIWLCMCACMCVCVCTCVCVCRGIDVSGVGG